MQRRLAILSIIALAIAGCATATRDPAAVDVTGHWSGLWRGYGVADIRRESPATADLTQWGADGGGILVLNDAAAVDTVPLTLRQPGMVGARVRFEVSGPRMIMRHELGRHLFVIDFTVEGDRMVGRIRDVEPLVELVLLRDRPPQAAAAPAPPPAAPPAPVVAPPPAAAPPPPPPAVAEAAPAAPEPRRETPPPTEFSAIPGLRAIYFDFDRSDIRAADAQVLTANATWLKAHPGMVLIEGHCDERGTNEYNMALGERRARSTMNFLVGQGIPAAEIAVVTYGEERPVCAEHTEACWKQNRRAVLLHRPR